MNLPPLGGKSFRIILFRSGPVTFADFGSKAPEHAHSIPRPIELWIKVTVVMAAIRRFQLLPMTCVALMS